MLDSCSSLVLGIAIVAALLILKVPLWIAFVLTGLAVAALAGKHYLALSALSNLIYDPNTWDLVVLLSLVATLVSLYRKTGFVDRIGEELALLIKRPKLISMFTPAIMGLLPVPGGALMSAPIVDRVGSYIGLDQRRKLYVNVWFRHVIFIVYPLSNVLILTAFLTGVSLWGIIYKQLPVALVMILIGYAISLRGARGNEQRSVTEHKSANGRTLLRALAPLLTTIALALATPPLVDRCCALPTTRLSMVLSVLAGIALLAALSKTRARELLLTAKSRDIVELAATGFTAMYLKAILDSIDLSCVAGYVSGLSPIAIVVSTPLLFSLIAGLVSSSVALSVPIIASIVDLDVELASLTYLSAFMGYLGSPLHLCYIYSAQYFKVPLVEGYKYLLPSIGLTLLFAVALYSLT